jgi:hypothetical protein
MTLSSLRAAAVTAATVLAASGVASAATSGHTAAKRPDLTFKLVRSAGSVSAGCLTHAKATVSITLGEPADTMVINASGLPHHTGFDVFIIQVPNAPFGLSWYQGDLHSNGEGKAHAEFAGRFSQETFVVAPGAATAPVVHHSPTADASTNPATAPVHMFHVGVWFNSASKAAAAGCANAVTPFNGDHTAGPQALSTQQYNPCRRTVPRNTGRAVGVELP